MTPRRQSYAAEAMRVWQAILRDRLARLRLGKPRSVPLRQPILDEMVFPDALLLRRELHQISALKQAAELLAVEAADRFAPAARQIGSGVMFVVRDSDFRNVLAADEIAADRHRAIAYAIGIGLALAEVEAERGWQRRDVIDARVWTALTLIHTGSEEVGAQVVTNYAARAGYWGARTGEFDAPVAS